MSSASGGAAVPWDMHVGHNLKAWRKARGLTQAEVAQQARDRGLDWAQRTVAAVESGARTLALHEAVALVAAVGIRPAELFVGDDWISFGKAGKVRASAVAALLSGKEDEVEATFHFGRPDDDFAAMERMIATAPESSPWWREAEWEDHARARRAAHGEAEMKAARSRGLDDLEPYEVALLAMKLFGGRTLTEERDRLLAEQVEPGTSQRRLQAIRGHITRTLLERIREEKKSIEEPAPALTLEEAIEQMGPEAAIAHLNALAEIPAVAKALEAFAAAHPEVAHEIAALEKELTPKQQPSAKKKGRKA